MTSLASNRRGGREKGRDKDLSFSWPLSVKPKDVNKPLTLSTTPSQGVRGPQRCCCRAVNHTKPPPCPISMLIDP
ncbi:hypothetical protein Q8A67_011972 [Cirrhinus molitorella]|uniref:Uncharacterized protein n=1 Tax=Cirrhinus molitorella TaxID=172907 RepID=A0AA88PNQ6_9TELE|nr:hypothetical protein Q8A67_011972 [Cirrhinus molitorella]